MSDFNPLEARPVPPVPREPVPGESRAERQRRLRLNHLDWEAYWAFMDARCSRCGMARRNVVHETDREHAPEGLAYYADVPFYEFMPEDRR